MNVTAYTADERDVSNPKLKRPPRKGTIAVADKSWRKGPDGKMYRVDSSGKTLTQAQRRSGKYPAVPAYPYGTTMKVYQIQNDGKQVLKYSGVVEDTGRGHLEDRNGEIGENAAEALGQEDLWIDVWVETKAEADQFGFRNCYVEIAIPKAE